MARPSLPGYPRACLAVAGARITAQWIGLAQTEVDVTAEAAAGPTVDITGLPSWTLDEGQLGDLELLLTGAFAPLTGFLGPADVAWVEERGTLEDGTPWPVPVVLDVPEDAVPASATRLALNDPEGTPLAILDITDRSPAPLLGQHSQTGRHARPDGAGPDGTGRRTGGPTDGTGRRPGRADGRGPRGRGAVGNRNVVALRRL